jgi:hypothetical protein
MKNISSELNETSLQQLFDALEARGGKDYTLGYVFSMLHRFMNDNPKLRKEIEHSINNIHKLNKTSPWLKKEI